MNAFKSCTLQRRKGLSKKLQENKKDYLQQNVIDRSPTCIAGRNEIGGLKLCIIMCWTRVAFVLCLDWLMVAKQMRDINL